jgi:hypothetical protein
MRYDHSDAAKENEVAQETPNEEPQT